MKKNFAWVAIAALLLSQTAGAATSRTQLMDQVGTTSGGSLLAVPSTGANLVSDSATQTLTNKTISGASNTFSNIPASAVSSGQVSVANGGTGVATITSNGIPYGQGASAIAVTAAGSQYQVLQAGASGVPQFLAVQLNQSAAVAGQLGVANGGSGASTLAAHGVVIGNGTSAVNVTSAGTAGQVLTSNGASADPTFQTVASAAPTINNSAASPQSVTAAGGVSLSAPTYNNVVFVKGGTASATVTVTATPSITACTAAGQKLHIVSASATDLVLLQNNGDLAGSQLRLNGPWTSGQNNGTPYTLELICDGAATPQWVEVARNN